MPKSVWPYYVNQCESVWFEYYPPSENPNENRKLKCIEYILFIFVSQKISYLEAAPKRYLFGIKLDKLDNFYCGPANWLGHRNVALLICGLFTVKRNRKRSQSVNCARAFNSQKRKRKIVLVHHKYIYCPGGFLFNVFRCCFVSTKNEREKKKTIE